MLHLELCQFDHTVSASVGDTGKVPDEGMALVIAGSLPGGEGIHVKPATDTAGEVFYGVSVFERRPPTSMPHVHEFILPASSSDPSRIPEDGTVVSTLPFLPVDGSFLLKHNDVIMEEFGLGDTSRALIIEGSNIKVEATPNALRYYAGVNDPSPGARISLQYSYLPDKNQQAALIGTVTHASPLSAGARVPCVRKGIIYTSFYDTSKEYTIGGAVGLYSGGRFRPAADATVDLRATVIHVPTTSNPFLGIEL